MPTQIDNILQIAPAYSEVILSKPDVVKEVIITFKNNSDVKVSLEVSPIDFRQDQNTGAIKFIGEDSRTYNYSLSSYMSLESNRIDISPRDTKLFTVQIKNRDDLRPGGHYGAVLAKLIQTETGKATVISPSLSALILLRKTGGEKYNLSITHTNWPETIVYSYPANLKVEFQNEGNVHVTPYGTILVQDVFNRVLAKGTLNITSTKVFPESLKTMKSDLIYQTWSFPVSINNMVITGQDVLKKTSFSYRETFIYINPYFLGILVACILLLIIRAFRKK